MDNVGDFAIFRIVYSKVNYQFARMCVYVCDGDILYSRVMNRVIVLITCCIGFSRFACTSSFHILILQHQNHCFLCS